jgi:hypothetical protein
MVDAMLILPAQPVAFFSVAYNSLRMRSKLGLYPRLVIHLLCPEPRPWRIATATIQTRATAHEVNRYDHLRHFRCPTTRNFPL